MPAKLTLLSFWTTKRSKSSRQNNPVTVLLVLFTMARSTHHSKLRLKHDLAVLLLNNTTSQSGLILNAGPHARTVLYAFKRPGGSGHEAGA